VIIVRIIKRKRIRIKDKRKRKSKISSIRKCKA